MNKYRVAFFGTPPISQAILETLTTMENVEVVLVVSQPDRKVGRKQEVVFGAVKQFCVDHNLQIFQPEKVSEIYNELVAANLDFLITCAYGQFIPTKILQLPKIEALNIHGSLLPKYRGGAPIQYAVINNEQQTGVSLMRMVKQMDAGPVFATRTIELAVDETTGSLFEKITKLGQEIIFKDLEKVATKQLSPVDQDESQATFAYNITTDQERINWNSSSKVIDCLVRGLSPKPIAHTFIGTERYKIGATKVLDDLKLSFKGEPGTIVDFDKEGILVKTKSGIVKILEIQRPGKKMQPASLYFENPSVKDLVIGSRFD